MFISIFVFVFVYELVVSAFYKFLIVYQKMTSFSVKYSGHNPSNVVKYKMSKYGMIKPQNASEYIFVQIEEISLNTFLKVLGLLYQTFL